jgi:WD40 repeat protein
MIEVDSKREECLLDVSPFLAACASNTKDACVTVFPVKGRPKFGLRQPRVKAPGDTVTNLGWAPYDPTVLYVGTTGGDITSWKISETGLKGDATKPTAKYDAGSEVKSMAFHPHAKTLLAAGLRSGHVVVLDETLSAPLVDLQHTRPVNSVCWSADGKYIFALYVDMLLKVWDVRANTVVVERKLIQSRAVGYLEPLPGNKVAVSYNEKKQVIVILDEKLEQLASREFEVNPNPIKIRYHFSGVLLGQTCKQQKAMLYSAEDLTDVAELQATDIMWAAMYEKEKPDPDGDILMKVTCTLTGNQVKHAEFKVPADKLPIKFNPFPIYETELTAAKWMAGEDGELKTEELIPTKKVEEVVEEVKEEAVQLVTRYRYLNAEPDPPSKFYTHLPVAILPNHEFNEIISNGKVFAFLGTGTPTQIYIMPVDKPQRFNEKVPRIVDPHKGSTTYITFSPHNPNILMSAGDDGKIKLWDVPDDLKSNITKERMCLQMNRSVGVCKFSESVRNLVLCASETPEIAIWDLNKEEKIRSFTKECPTQIQDVAFDAYSSKVYAVFKDGTLAVFDPREKEPKVQTSKCHLGPRHRRVLDLPDYGRFATFGANKKGFRECSIWDPENIEKPLKTVEFDNSSSPLLPMYEEGSGIIYCGGKGDGHVRFVELCHDDRIVASMGCFDSSEPERGLCLMPRQFLNVMTVECSRMFKLSPESLRMLHWRTPRNRLECFQDDIFGPSRDTRNPLMEVMDWEDGQVDQFPILQIQPEGTKKISEVQPLEKKVVKKYLPGEEEKIDYSTKKLTIDEIVAMAPQISTSDDDDYDVKDEDSDSW